MRALLCLVAAIVLHLGAWLAAGRRVPDGPEAATRPPGWVQVLDAGVPEAARPHDPGPAVPPPPAPEAAAAETAVSPNPALATLTAAEPLAQDSPGDDAPYLPRAQLDRGPRPLAPVELPYPEQAPAGDFRAVLTLLIDADGRVQRVRVDSGSLPAMLEDAARQAFLAARFSPGEKDGAAVRSRLRVEVRYSAEALAPVASDPAAAAASR